MKKIMEKWMWRPFNKKVAPGKTGMIMLGSFLALITAVSLASANHSWSTYHWARTLNPFTLKLGNNVSSTWAPYLTEASNDWSVSSILDTTIITGANVSKPRVCSPVSGRVEVCSAKYGSVGWLGIAQVWVSGSHITQSTVKVNDTYFTTATYNTPAWRRLVMCQEVGHAFGLDHQDTGNTNLNMGSCMDYTSNPAGPPSNEHPNTHDYDQLVTIYTHFDSTTTVGQTINTMPSAAKSPGSNGPRGWGKLLRLAHGSQPEVYERDFGNGHKMFTFVTWAVE